MSEYTPSVDWAQVGYAIARANHGVEHRDAREEFLRMLNAERAKAWDYCARVIEDHGLNPQQARQSNPFTKEASND